MHEEDEFAHYMTIVGHVNPPGIGLRRERVAERKRSVLYSRVGHPRFREQLLDVSALVEQQTQRGV